MSAFRVATALALVYLVLPRLMFKKPKCATNMADRFAIDMIRMTTLLIVGVHVLVPLQLFQVTGIMLAAITWIWATRLRPAGWTLANAEVIWDRIVEATLYLLEAASTDGNERVKAAVKVWWKASVLPRLRPRRIQMRTALTLGMSVPLVVVLGVSLAMRLYFPLTHEAFVPSDSYVHLAWIKYLSMGSMYRDGIYPNGMHAVLAVTEKLSPATNFDVLRFAGPFLNTFTVFLIYILSLRLTRHVGASLVASAVLGFVAMRPEIGVLPFRQVGALPQEFAALLTICGLLMAIEYVNRPSRQRLFYLASAGMITTMTHPVATMLYVVVAASCALAAAVRTGRVRAFFRVALATFGGTLAGCLYIPLALAAGARLYAPVKKTNPIGSYEGTGVPLLPLIQNPAGIAAMIGVAIGTLYGVTLLRKRDSRAPMVILAAGFLTLCSVIQLSGDRFFDNWYALRWNDLVLLVLPIGIALGIAPLAELWRQRSIWVRTGFSAATGVAFITAMIVALPPTVPRPVEDLVEHESSARYLSQIVGSNPRLGFTVVGPPASYDRVLGSGYHVQLTDFVKNLDKSKASDPSFAMPIPTRNTYVMIEKRPFELSRGTTTSTDQYLSLERRSRLMKSADDWMRTYSRFHHTASIAFEDADVRVWQITQPADAPYAKAYGLVDS